MVVLSMVPATGEHLDELATSGVEIASLDMVPSRPTPSALRRYVSFVRRWRPDIVHSHMVHANLLARAGRPFTRSVPVISTIHSLVEGARWRELAYRLTDPLASVTVAVSSAAAARAVRAGAVPARRITTIRNGLDLSSLAIPDGARASIRLELGVADSDFVWVGLGRLVPAKGFDVLLRAFDTVRRTRASTRLVIAGDGPEHKALDRLRGELDLVHSVVLLGDRTDAPSVLAAADGFVLSSRWEGLPMVLLEAAALGLPIVATDVGGCREVLRPELGGVLTSPSPESIAAGMLRIQAMGAGERTRIGAALKRHVLTEFDMERTVDRWQGLYADVLASRDRSTRVDWANRDGGR